MEAAQRKSKRAKLVINDEYMHDVALKLLLQSGEYETETREWLYQGLFSPPSVKSKFTRKGLI